MGKAKTALRLRHSAWSSTGCAQMSELEHGATDNELRCIFDQHAWTSTGTPPGWTGTGAHQSGTNTSISMQCLGSRGFVRVYLLVFVCSNLVSTKKNILGVQCCTKGGLASYKN